MRQRSTARRLSLIAAGVLIAGVGLVVLLNREPPPAGPGDDDEDVIELIPEPLAVDDIGGRLFDPRTDTRMPVLAEGGSIQSTDEEGNLAQQYRFDRLDPNPPGMPANWVQMDRPRAEIYLADGRVLSLAGDSALAHVPHRILESGTLTGNVTIRLYEPPPGRVLDTARDRPQLEVHADEATFDNVIGEVRVADRFLIEAPTLEFAGSNLMILVNDQADRPELTVEVEKVESMRLVRAATAFGPAPTTQPPEADTDADARTPPDAGGRPPLFYRLTLHDDLHVQAGPASTGQTITGDTLAIVFSSQSRGGSGERPSSNNEAAENGRVTHSEHPEAPGRLAPPPGDNDVYVTCSGRLTIVPIADGSQGASPRDTVLTITGSPVQLVDAAHDARATCNRMLYHALDEKVELKGSPAHPVLIAAPQLAAGGDGFWIRRGAGGFTGAGWLESYDREAPADDDTFDELTDQKFRLTWRDGADLEFDEPTGSESGLGPLRRAAFHGDVLARGEAGLVTCEDLEVDLDVTDDGRSVPTLITASGNVRAADPDQTVWADHVVVTLDEGDSGTDIETVTAKGNVQVRMARGTRAFADTLLGDASGETVELTGDAVAIAHEQWLVDGGTRLVLSRRTDTARWFGPGRARAFEDEVILDADARLPRPAVDGEPDLYIDWSESMLFDNAFNDGAGAIDLVGDVKMISTRDPLQRDSLEAGTVTIRLARQTKTGISPVSKNGTDPRFSERILDTVTARDNVRLESRSWKNSDLSDQPSVFYVAGPRLNYNDRTGEALVQGAGQLLIRDLRADATDHAVMSGKGTTDFRWREKLHMTRAAGTTYDIDMLDGVEMRHLDPDGSASTLVCDALTIGIDRPESRPSTTRSRATESFPGASGRAELQRIHARGGVFLRTPQRDVECGSLSYDVLSGLAELTARPGGTATIYTRGNPVPTRVQRAVWDMKRDTLKALRGSGGGTR